MLSTEGMADALQPEATTRQPY
eukprot:COSAG06_NODE_40414_length_402_cov_0.838284_1_plen_21_part_01